MMSKPLEVKRWSWPLRYSGRWHDVGKVVRRTGSVIMIGYSLKAFIASVALRSVWLGLLGLFLMGAFFIHRRYRNCIKVSSG
jgi:hypothetical protein